MKLLILCLVLFAGIIALGVYFRANLTEFCESVKPELDNAETALLSGDTGAAVGFLAGAEKLCGKNKNLLFVYLNHMHYEGLVEKLSRARTFARAGDIPSALSEISSARSKLDDLYGFDKIAVGNIF